MKPFALPVSMTPGSFRWWPFLGLFLLLGAFGHFGFGFRCDKDTGTTDPGVPAETTPDPLALSPPITQDPSVSSIAWASLPVGGGLLLAGLARGPRRD